MTLDIVKQNVLILLLYDLLLEVEKSSFIIRFIASHSRGCIIIFSNETILSDFPEKARNFKHMHTL